MPMLVRFCTFISLVAAMSFLAFAIFLEADAVFCYTRKKEDLADLFDRKGYIMMRYGLLFVLGFMNYLASTMFPPLFSIDPYWAEILQAILPFAFAFALYMIWLVFKCRKGGKKLCEVLID